MTTIRESQEAVDRLRSLVKEFSGFSESEVRRDDFGAFKLSDAAEQWKLTKTFLEPILEMPLTNLPANSLGDLNQQLSNTVEVLKRIRQLPPNDPGSARSGRDQANNFLGQCSETVQRAARLGSAMLMQPGFFSSAVTSEIEKRWSTIEAERVAQEAQRTTAASELASHREKAATALLEIQSLNQKARDLIERAGFAKEARYFEEEAKSSRNGARTWLVGAGLIGAAICYFTVTFVEPDLRTLPPNPSVGEVTRHAIPRIIFFATAYALLVWSVRNYSACRHNFVVNRHRANALSTFQAFSSATNDPTVRNAILVQATSAIFAAQSSGFLKDENVPQESSKIIEIFKDIAKPDAK